MIDRLKKVLQDASDMLMDQAKGFSNTAREKSYEIIEDWLGVFPALEKYGLQLTSFALSIALSPALEAEMTGDHDKFSSETLDTILEEVKGDPALTSVFTTIKTTYSLHRRTKASLPDPPILTIKIRISPEIKVYLGEPIIE